MNTAGKKLVLWTGKLKVFGAGALISSAIAVTFLACSGQPRSFHRFTDEVKSAQIESPLLHITTSEPENKAAEQFRWVAGKYLNRDSAFSDRTDSYVKKVEIVGSLRTALFAPAPSKFTFSVRIPSKPILDFGYALMPDAWEMENSATTFKIWLVKDGKEHLLFSDSIDPRNDESARRWFDEGVELSAYKEEHVELVFETTQSSEGGTAGYAVWSNPMLYSTAEESEKPNVVLISIDTLRADRLGCYGHHRQTSPNIDRLAQDGVLFKNASSQSPWTIPSHGSIFTSKLPHKHMGTIDRAPPRKIWHPLPFSNLTLAEILRENGYVTAAFTSGGYMISRTGLHQGFDLYHNNTGPEWDPSFNVERLVSRTSDWLRKSRQGPFFLLFHTFEVHSPYLRHYFTDGLDTGRLCDSVEHYEDREYLIEATDAEKEYTTALYDGGIYHADRYIGMLLETLSQLGLMQNTMVVLTSDHGEEFWEHYPLKAAAHAHSLYDELLHVPLIFVSPDTEVKGRIVEEQVRSIDIFPTILSALSIKYDEREIDGESLLPLIEGNSMKELAAYGEDLQCGPDRMSIRTKEYKYIYCPDLTQKMAGHGGVDFYKRGLTLLSPMSQEELYDLEKDPNETTNIAGIQPHLTEELRKQVREVFGIPTVYPLDGPSGNVYVRLEGIAKRVEAVTVQVMDGPTLSSSDGSLSIHNGDRVMDLRFDSTGSGERQVYLISIIYDDRTFERMSVTGLEHSESIEGISTPKKEGDEELIKQLKQVGYMYIDPGTTSLVFSSFAYLLGMLAVLSGSLIFPFRWLFRRFNSRLGQDRKALALLLSGAVIFSVAGSAAACVFLLLL